MAENTAGRRPRFEEKLDIAVIYRTQFFTAALWGWVTALRMQNVKVTDAVRMFQHHFDITDEDTDSLRRIYTEKNRQLQQALHKEGGIVVINCK